MNINVQISLTKSRHTCSILAVNQPFLTAAMATFGSWNKAGGSGHVWADWGKLGTIHFTLVHILNFIFLRLQQLHFHLSAAQTTKD